MAKPNRRRLLTGIVSRSVGALIALVAAAVLFSATRTTDAQPTSTESPAAIVRYEPVVVAEYPHDVGAYTQGLEFVGDVLAESTGRYGRSTMRLVEPTTGQVVTSVDLDEELFGEGATAVEGEFWQLTWKAEQLIVRDGQDLSERRRISYEGEGWGLCDAGDSLIMSNGSDELSFRDRQSFDEIGSVTVTEDGVPVADLNELECVGALVWANVYQTNRIIAIDRSSGRVAGVADLTPLVPRGFEGNTDLVLNGIAFQAASGRFWITGKEWPVMYEIELREIEP